jgi:hypothetical protein
VYPKQLWKFTIIYRGEEFIRQLVISRCYSKGGCFMWAPFNGCYCTLMVLEMSYKCILLQFKTMPITSQAQLSKIPFLIQMNGRDWSSWSSDSNTPWVTLDPKSGKFHHHNLMQSYSLLTCNFMPSNAVSKAGDATTTWAFHTLLKCMNYDLIL